MSECSAIRPKRTSDRREPSRLSLVRHPARYVRDSGAGASLSDSVRVAQLLRGAEDRSRHEVEGLIERATSSTSLAMKSPSVRATVSVICELTPSASRCRRSRSPDRRRPPGCNPPRTSLASHAAARLPPHRRPDRRCVRSGANVPRRRRPRPARALRLPVDGAADVMSATAWFPGGVGTENLRRPGPVDDRCLEG
jgi:hypothetical protein